MGDALLAEEATARFPAAFEFRRAQLFDLLEKVGVMRQQVAFGGEGFIKEFPALAGSPRASRGASALA